MTFDPYAELGVGRGATPKDIRVAFRKRSKKTHPDNGGSAETFEMTTRALAILSDPARRAHFDATGSCEPPEADNRRAHALGVIEHFLGSVVDAYEGQPGGTGPVRDPRRRPLLLEMIAQTPGRDRGGPAQHRQGRAARRLPLRPRLALRHRRPGRPDPPHVRGPPRQGAGGVPAPARRDPDARGRAGDRGHLHVPGGRDRRTCRRRQLK